MSTPRTDVVSSLLTPDASANATLRVSSVDAKPADFLAALEKLENKQLQTSYISLDDFKAREAAAKEKEDPALTIYTLSRIWYSGQSDFTRKPKALYYRGGKDEEDAHLAGLLFKDVPKRAIEEVLRDLL